MRPASPPDARLVVLDLDGTLARLDVDWDGVRARLARLALRDDPAARPDRVSRLLARASVPTRAAMLAALADAEERAAECAPLNRALLDWLAERPVALLTLNSERAADRVADRAGLAGRLGGVVGRESTAAPKPDPAGLHALAALAGCPPADALLVGDSPGDWECARRAGAAGLDVRAVGVDWVPARPARPARP